MHRGREHSWAGDGEMEPPPPEIPFQPPKAPTTTAQEDITEHGKRRINFIWEATQSVIALSVTLATLYVAARLAITDHSQTAAFLLLSNAFFLVIGFYFGRTNHTRVGGVAEPTR